MALSQQTIAEAIDTAPYNHGVSGASWLAMAGNVTVSFDNGDVALFEHEGDKSYQVHFLFQSRGKKAIEHAKESFRVMFVEHSAQLIFGLVPDHRRDVKMLSRWIGGKFAGKRNTPEGVCELYVLSNIMFFKRAN